jgi:hypothetical protein
LVLSATKFIVTRGFDVQIPYIYKKQQKKHHLSYKERRDAEEG